MSLPDDSALSQLEYSRVRKEAERALRESGAFGVLPTPMDAIMRAANIEEIRDDVLDPSLLQQLRHKAGKTGKILKRALSKVLGVFHAPSGLVFIDKSIMAVKRRFVGFHESGHGFMPWQRAAYTHVEDCESALSPGAASLFDREANVFATEVLFQLDTFHEQASEHEFGIFTPVRLSKEYNASIYASIREYVRKNRRNCAVVVLNNPAPCENDGFTATLRRYEESDSFVEMFGTGNWPERFTPDDQIGALVPLGKTKSSGRHEIVLEDRNNDKHECIAEAFTNSYQVFVLIHEIRSLSTSMIIMPSI
ncbi:ImmA/IrrE family metallo-endopeptidase [Roseibium album]|uniref:ImmA/IrrE family metallo-endopeptidase n=1 Tax=Roseibium album TaxID=311410 RepID=UPI0024922862|nr:hypothetical protein [Roseibium album]